MTRQSTVDSSTHNDRVGKNRQSRKQGRVKKTKGGRSAQEDQTGGNTGGGRLPGGGIISVGLEKGG